MNKKIEELYKQSFMEVYDENSFPCMTFSKQRFAELIVRECADTAAGERSGWEARKAIEEHFGVE